MKHFKRLVDFPPDQRIVAALGKKICFRSTLRCQITRNYHRPVVLIFSYFLSDKCPAFGRTFKLISGYKLCLTW